MSFFPNYYSCFSFSLSSLITQKISLNTQTKSPQHEFVGKKSVGASHGYEPMWICSGKVSWNASWWCSWARNNFSFRQMAHLIFFPILRYLNPILTLSVIFEILLFSFPDRARHYIEKIVRSCLALVKTNREKFKLGKWYWHFKIDVDTPKSI